MADTSFDSSQAGKVARAVLGDVRKQRIPAGARLWSVRELAERYDTSIATTQKALQLLQDRGIVECRPRQGVYLCDRQRGQIGIIVVARRERLTDGTVKPRDESAGSQLSREIFDAATSRFHLSGYQVVSVPVFREDLEKPDAATFEHLDKIRHRLDGAILWHEPRIVDYLERRDLTWAAVDFGDRTHRRNFVVADNYTGFSRIGHCLAHTGRHRVAVIMSQLFGRIPSIDRVMGIYHGFVTAHTPTTGIESIELGGHRAVEAGVIEVVRERLRRPDMPRALICGSDSMAVAATRAARECGLRVPEDVAVVGATGFDVARYAVPSITVVAQPTQRMGWEVGGMLLDMLEQRSQQAPCRYVPTPVTFRESFNVPDTLRNEIQQDYERDLARLDASASTAAPTAVPA